MIDVVEFVERPLRLRLLRLDVLFLLKQKWISCRRVRFLLGMYFGRLDWVELGTFEVCFQYFVFYQTLKQRLRLESKIVILA